jgi:hypothetical protein
MGPGTNVALQPLETIEKCCHFCSVSLTIARLLFDTSSSI